MQNNIYNLFKHLLRILCLNFTAVLQNNLLYKIANDLDMQILNKRGLSCVQEYLEKYVTPYKISLHKYTR